MLPGKSETLPIRDEPDVVLVRRRVGQFGEELGFTTLSRTKIVTAASELGRNTLIHGQGGSVRIEVIAATDRPGLRLTFEDKGPGIPDIDQALSDGFTSGNGMGLGLGGAKRLSHEFEISSDVGSGTKVSMLRWK